ncbi:MAG: hypothetical protein R3E90_15910 [Marinicella sp.]|nr:hypothetical protein [Xanthomonadales bacterium]
MHCVFIIQQHLSKQQIEQQYLLMIAMLNFDFKVQIIFDKQSWHHWQSHKTLNQKYNALNLYGAEALLALNATKQPDLDTYSCRTITPVQMQQILASAEFIS